MNYKHFICVVVLGLLYNCKQESYLTRIEGDRLEINDSLVGDKAIEDFIEPFRNHVNNDLDSVISYAVATYSKSDGDLNTAIGNFMADAIYELSNPIYKARINKDIDLVLLNHGGIRSIIPKGDLTSRTAYQIMPFENNVVVIEMKGIYVKELVAYLQNARRAHPIAKLKIVLDNEYNITEATVNGEEIQDERIYSVATSDYLYNGGDNMEFLQKGENVHDLNYKIRNSIIDYFKKYDTINPIIDDRFIKTN